MQVSDINMSEEQEKSLNSALASVRMEGFLVAPQIIENCVGDNDCYICTKKAKSNYRRILHIILP